MELSIDSCDYVIFEYSRKKKWEEWGDCGSPGSPAQPWGDCGSPGSTAQPRGSGLTVLRDIGDKKHIN